MMSISSSYQGKAEGRLFVWAIVLTSYQLRFMARGGFQIVRFLVHTCQSILKRSLPSSSPGYFGAPRKQSCNFKRIFLQLVSHEISITIVEPLSQPVAVPIGSSLYALVYTQSKGVLYYLFQVTSNEGGCF